MKNEIIINKIDKLEKRKSEIIKIILFYEHQKDKENIITEQEQVIREYEKKLNKIINDIFKQKEKLMQLQ